MRMRVAVGFAVCTVAALAQVSPDARALAPPPEGSLKAFRLGETLLKQKDYQSAANQFRNALAGDRKPDWVVVWSHVYLARIFSMTGQHERAVLEYQAAVRTNDNTGSAVDEALSFLESAGADKPRPDPRAEQAQLRVPAGVYPVGPGITAPVPTRTEPPAYSEEALLAELEGTVWLAVVVGLDGTPGDIQVLRPLGLGLDERAAEAVRGWRFWPGKYEEKEVPTLTTIPVDFVLPSKFSRWHLIRATFHAPEGVSRPIFRGVAYPPGGGISRGTMDHARIVAAVGRQATATLSFDIDEHGRPVHFRVDTASDTMWGPEAIAFVQNWEFAPGIQDGKPVSVPCTLTLVWGQRSLAADVIREIAQRTEH